MSQDKFELTLETSNKVEPQCECEEEYPDGYIKIVRLNWLSNTIRLINFMPPFNGPMSYKPLERICKLKKEIIEKDPNWILADNITMLECQVLNKIDNIDHTRPWNSDRNKLRYIELFQTITKLRTLHPNWVIDLSEARNPHLCRCCPCIIRRREMLNSGDSSPECSTSEDEDNKKVAPSTSKVIPFYK
jgi:hypothetical protein